MKGGKTFIINNNVGVFGAIVLYSDRRVRLRAQHSNSVNDGPISDFMRYGPDLRVLWELGHEHCDTASCMSAMAWRESAMRKATMTQRVLATGQGASAGGRTAVDACAGYPSTSDATRSRTRTPVAR